ncbi:helix-turn-helix domain-containing protein [Bradyrhizobium sp. NP1]|uniref:helix-turn-helix domain-containing protein n=1 Tax=Bradyrhizobium sp. NP1 TaxID=3049772 RepID=UPI0025A68D33|nr:helix-turn-helix domain-containing protein [Bradyrhizobium sp. NP1]WJR79018.1 helix-turn-helix domain-containing protein [Bradyrhizobium sp. NP1]
MTTNLRYDYVGDQRLSEGADWIGTFRGLRTHFHEEIQVSVSIFGLRRYMLGNSLVGLEPGDVLIVPAQVVHSALPTSYRDTRSTEFFLIASKLPDAARSLIVGSNYLVLSAPWALQLARDDLPGAIASAVSALGGDSQAILRREAARPAESLDLRLVDESQSVASRAMELGLSREGYIRRFVRRFGMPPHAHRLAGRLNEGRELLRRGLSIADVAHATGFSDQSHFGRHFLQSFGATPGQFKSAHVTR